MKLSYDSKANAAYFDVSDKPFHRTQIVDGNRLINYAEDGTVIGVELLAVNRGVDLRDLPYADEIEEALRPHGIRVLA